VAVQQQCSGNAEHEKQHPEGRIVDVVDTWTGSTACALQQALRMTNDRFAEHLGVAVRTVAGWHSDPGIVPRTEIQAALDTAYERATAAVLRRFSTITRPPAGPVQAQALRVAVAVVIRRDEVLLVCRRGDGQLSWQFPAGVVKPGAAAEAVTVQETHAETGVHCAVRQHLGNRLHPTTGVLCDYYLCDYLTGEASNRDPIENVDVAWTPRASINRFIPADKIYPPIVAALEEA
jgi:8-oxo-dGTP diphosphatase